MLESVTLGIIQGITEWLPISSEGALLLTNLHVFGDERGLKEFLELALFLHLGTFFAALWYFRDDAKTLLVALVSYPAAKEETRKLLVFLLLTSAVSGIIGFGLFAGIKGVEEQLVFSSRIITVGIGVLLLGTAGVQLKAKAEGKRQPFGLKGVRDLKLADGVLLGAVQGLAVLPGLSRSGLTISALLLRRFGELQSLRLSFLMSLPAILGGNIALNLEGFAWSASGVVGLVFAFFFGLLTIHALLKVARRINFGYFALLFGILTIASAFI